MHLLKGKIPTKAKGKWSKPRMDVSTHGTSIPEVGTSHGGYIPFPIRNQSAVILFHSGAWHSFITTSCLVRHAWVSFLLYTPSKALSSPLQVVKIASSQMVRQVLTGKIIPNLGKSF
jgi:hypothetical protein